MNPDPLHWEHGVLATGPPGKSLQKGLIEEVIEVRLLSEVTVEISSLQDPPLYQGFPEDDPIVSKGCVLCVLES